VFASVLETHGYFNESIEASDDARGLVSEISILAENVDGTVIEITTVTGTVYRFGVSNRVPKSQEIPHCLVAGQDTFTWVGAFSAL